AEAAHDSHNFVVAPSWIGRRLDEEVRRTVQAVPAGVDEVVQTASRSGRVNKEIVREASAADGRLRTFDAYAQRELIPVLRNAESVRTLPCPADDVLRVDLQRERFLPVLNSLLAFGDQAPHLAAREVETVVKLHACPQLPLPEHVAVALPVVGR